MTPTEHGKTGSQYTYGFVAPDGLGQMRATWRERIKAWWRRFGTEARSSPATPAASAPDGWQQREQLGEFRYRTYLARRQQVIDAATLLYNNRLGWGDGRPPDAPRAFWAALGIALGEDVSWVRETALNDRDAQLTIAAAHELLREVNA